MRIRENSKSFSGEFVYRDFDLQLKLNFHQYNVYKIKKKTLFVFNYR